MIFKKLFGKSQRENGLNRRGSPIKTGKDIEHMAFLQISSAIRSQKDISAIFEVIGRESARCLNAHRSIIFLVDGEKGVLKNQFSYCSDPLDEKLGFLEEKEIARRAVTDKRPFLLKEPKDFSEFFKYDERERKITSLLSIPFGAQGKMMGSLNLSLINGKRTFNETDLQFLCIFANHTSIALQNQFLLDEIRKAATLRKNYEQHLDELMGELQSLSEEERRRIDDHIGRFLSGIKAETPPVPKPLEMVSAGGKGIIRLTGEASFEDSPENITEKIQVEIEEPSGKAGSDLSRANIFIPSANPRDLGEQFILRLYLSEGQPLEVPCKVIFSNKYGQESQNLRRGMGIKFLDLPPEVQKQLEELIQASKQQGGSAKQEQPRFSQEPNGQEKELRSLALKPSADLS
jgi:Tfp pilus assembly protein PilZ